MARAVSQALPHLYKAIRNAEVMPLIGPSGHEYLFRVFAFGECGKYLDSHMITEVANALVERIKSQTSAVDTIVTLEPGGVAWGLVASFMLNCNLFICRLTRENQLPDSTIIVENGYTRKEIDLTGLGDLGDFIILDDVISTGSTLRRLLTYLEERSMRAEMVLAIYSKADAHIALQNRFGVPIQILAEQTRVLR